MLTVKQTAKKLGVSETRIRAMIHSGILEGQKFSHAWGVLEESVLQRLRESPTAGRPRKDSRAQKDNVHQPQRNIVAARKLYKGCKDTIAGCYDAGFLTQAKNPEEERFYIFVADFFLQEKQRELIEQKVF